MASLTSFTAGTGSMMPVDLCVANGGPALGAARVQVHLDDTLWVDRAVADLPRHRVSAIGTVKVGPPRVPAGPSRASR